MSPTPHISTSPLTLDDLISDLSWPRLLRAPALGLNPARLFLSFLIVIGTCALLRLGALIDVRLFGPPAPPPVNAARGAWLVDPSALWHAAVECPLHFLRTQPVTAVLIVPILLAIGAILAGAVCRSAACELALGRAIAWPEAFAFAIARARSLVGAIAAPLLASWGIALVLAGAGFLLLRWPGVNLLGALLFPIAIALGAIVTLLAIAWVLGVWLFLPAIACDNADMTDAVQRGYAYVFGRPIRLLVYLVCLAVPIVLALALAGALAALTLGVAAEATGVWAGDRGRLVLADGVFGRLRELGLGGTAGATPAVDGGWAGSIIGIWTLLAGAMVLAYGVSMALSGATSLYLVLRRVVDGQDAAEIWLPTGEGASS